MAKGTFLVAVKAMIYPPKIDDDAYPGRVEPPNIASCKEAVAASGRRRLAKRRRCVRQRRFSASALHVDNGDAVHDWALAGLGIMLKSEVDVAEDLDAGRLERVLPNWDGGEAPIVALYPSAEHLPLKTRILLDELVTHIAAVLTDSR
jgi:DNA-binding transcriptional LysR family regulator